MSRRLKHTLNAALIAVCVPLSSFAASAGLAHEAHHEPTPPTAAVTAEENSFLTENDVAMTKMINDMAVKPSGDIDHDFVAMMTPHHQGAIDMAVLQLRYGKNEQLRRIAQEIIVDQMQEIAAMKLAIGEQVSTTAPAPTQSPSSPTPWRSRHRHAHGHARGHEEIDLGRPK